MRFEIERPGLRVEVETESEELFDRALDLFVGSGRQAGGRPAPEEMAPASPSPGGDGAAGGDGAHRHHFVLESPNGPTSKGVCSCGAAKEFRNSFTTAETGAAATRAYQNRKRRCPACGANWASRIHREQCGTKAERAARQLAEEGA